MPYATACGTTPVKKTVTFFGKGDTYSFVAMKRNYEPDTIFVTRESQETIDFNLKEISDIHSGSTRLNENADKKICLLPVDPEIFLHKGVGNLDKYEKSNDLSNEVEDSLNLKLSAICRDSGMHYVCLKDLNEKIDWKLTRNELSNYLLSLDLNLLPYYAKPPALSESIVEKLSCANNHLEQEPLPDQPYWLYVWCKSIKPTSGRILGNIGANIGAGALQGYETAVYGRPTTYIDPDAFALDYQTIYMVAMIEPESGELLSLEQYQLPFELTSSKSQDSFVKTLIGVYKKIEMN